MDRVKTDTILFNKLKNMFLDWYGRELYYWDGKNAKHLKMLIQKIKFVGAKKHANDSNDDWVIRAFEWILTHLPEWIKKTPSIPLINSQFNQIIAYGRSKQPLSHLSTEYLNSIVTRSQGINPNLPQPDNG